mgnify:CR=1 FL=1|jgi:uncharacterized membrane protein YiaA
MVLGIYTTIEVKKTTRDKLKKIKIHQRQSYDELINKLVDGAKKK